MARAIWKGSISFGLVEIPVGLYAAESRDEVGFTMLDKRDFSPVGYKRYNKATGEEIAWGEIVKGYEYDPGEYVLMTDEDLKAAAPKKTQTIDIVGFVDREEVAPWFFEAPYYLEPLKKDSKGYALLREALTHSKKVGIARFILRTRENLAALIARGPVLVLNTLRYAHEIRDPGELTVPGDNLARLGVSSRELQMAEQLIEGMTDKWDPAAFKDTYREDLMKLVEEKVRAGQTKQVWQPKGETGTQQRAEVVDLMPLLRQSLEKRGAGGRAKAPEEAAPADENPAPARKTAKGGKAAKSATKKAGTSSRRASRSA